MASALHEFLSKDHERLDALLTETLRADGTVDEKPYAEFREGLLWHIAVEETVLFRELRRQRGATPLEHQLHLDHAALAGLLVPPPSKVFIDGIIEILTAHNPLEERPGGLYEILEELSGSELDDLMKRVHAVPPVRVAPHADSPIVFSSIEQLLRRAAENREKVTL